jgi:hypothetical protein
LDGFKNREGQLDSGEKSLGEHKQKMISRLPDARRPKEIVFGAISWPAMLLLPLLLQPDKLRRSSRHAGKLKFADLVLAGALASLPLLSLTSCGGSGSGGSSGGQPTSANTPPETYTVNLVVTINGAARSIPLILTVQ